MFIESLCIQGSLTGLITGLIITLWVGIGAQLYPPLPIKTKPLPLSVAGCNAGDTNITTTVAAWTSTALPTTGPRQEFFSSWACHQGTTGKFILCFLSETDEFLYFYE